MLSSTIETRTNIVPSDVNNLCVYICMNVCGCMCVLDDTYTSIVGAYNLIRLSPYSFSSPTKQAMNEKVCTSTSTTVAHNTANRTKYRNELT